MVRPQFVEPKPVTRLDTDGMTSRMAQQTYLKRKPELVAQARLEHQRHVVRWRAQHEAWQSEHRPQTASQTLIINNLRADIRATLNGLREQFPARTLPWRFLPKSELDEEKVVLILRSSISSHHPQGQLAVSITRCLGYPRSQRPRRRAV